MRFAPIFALLGLACGPRAQDSGEGTTGAASTTATSSTQTSEAESSSGTEPPPACDPAFDSGEPFGTKIWKRQFGAELPEAHQYGVALALDAFGEVYATGRIDSDAQDESDGWMHALAADGTSRWDDRYAGTAGLSDHLTDVSLGPAGEIFVVGVEETERLVAENNPHSKFVVVVLAYGPDGTHLWRQAIEPSPDADPVVSFAAVAVRSDARIAVVASEALDGGWPRLLLVDLAPNGELDARSTYLEDGYRGLWLVDIDVDAADHLYVSASGKADSGVDDDHQWIGRWTPDGALEWSVGAPLRRASARAVVALDDGAIVLARVDANETAPITRRPWLARYDGSGEQVWTHQPQWDSTTTVEPIALARSCEGDVLVLANIGDVGQWLARVSADGEPLADIDLEGDASFAGIATDPAGNPVLVGHRLDAVSDSELVVQKLAR